MTFADLAVLGVFSVIAVVSAAMYRNDAAMADRSRPRSAFRYAVTRVAPSAGLAALYGARLTDWPIWLRMWRDDWLAFAGSIVAIAGISLFVAAKVRLGDSYSPCYQTRMPEKLVREGVYRYIKHPIYVGNLAVFAGALAASGSVWVAVVLLTLGWIYLRCARSEERELKVLFPGTA